MLSTYYIVLDYFQLKDKHEKTRFFEETFLVTKTMMEVVLGMLFLVFSKVEINFAD